MQDTLIVAVLDQEAAIFNNDVAIEVVLANIAAIHVGTTRSLATEPLNVSLDVHFQTMPKMNRIIQKTNMLFGGCDVE